jgi:hypothetical protein
VGHGQPTIFLPGRHKGVYNFTWSGSPLAWNLTQSAAQVSSSSPACVQVTPTLSCVAKSGTTYTAWFGYENPNEFPVFLKKGTPANRFVPVWGPQPALFKPGILENAFKLTWNGSALRWELNGLTVSASKNSPSCSTQNIAGAKGLTAMLDELPPEFALGSNYPNPFNPETTIPIALPEAAHVTVTVFDILGREVATLMDETYEAGVYELRWEAGTMPAGIYFIRMRAAGKEFLRSVMLMK